VKANKGAHLTKRILIVEDNEKNRRLIRDILEYHGYEVLAHLPQFRKGKAMNPIGYASDQAIFLTTF